MSYTPENNFTPGFSVSVIPSENDFIFAFREDKLLILKNDLNAIPELSKLLKANISIENAYYIASYKEHKCFVVNLDKSQKKPPGMFFYNLRKLMIDKLLSKNFMKIAGLAKQVISWESYFNFCSTCGHPLQVSTRERSKSCVNCNKEFFPPVTPAIIVAVVKIIDGEKRILLARNKQFKTGFYSLVAGFVDIAEGIEDCLHRELAEEVNIEVKNLKYFSSQAWPHPHSLMIGFSAEYKTGELRPDNDEILDAKWFSKNELPAIPSKGSLSRDLIDAFLNDKI